VAFIIVIGGSFNTVVPLQFWHYLNYLIEHHLFLNFDCINTEILNLI
jgi:hypothetical protein